MSRLDHEKLNRRRFVSDDVGDDLPPIGSWADRRRYFDEGCVATERTSPVRHRICTPPQQPSTDVTADQLRAFLAKAEQPGFAAQYPWHREETLNAIQKLRGRLLSGQRSRASTDLVKRAGRVLSTYRPECGR